MSACNKEPEADADTNGIYIGMSNNILANNACLILGDFSQKILVIDPKEEYERLMPSEDKNENQKEK